MAYFYYRAIDKRGNEKEGVVNAVSYQEAVIQIKGFDLYPTGIYQTTKKDYAKEASLKRKVFLWQLLHPKIKTKEIVPFVSDFSILLDAGISLSRALSVLYNQTISRRMQKVIGELRTDIESGQSLSDSLSKHPEHFNALFINMVRAGELGGILSDSLTRLAVLYEKNARLEAKMRAALLYPLVVLTFALSVVIFIVAFIVPKFFVIFADLGTSLPKVTIVLYKMSLFVRAYWPLLIVGCVVALGVFKIIMQLKRVQFFIDAIKLRLPVFGVLYRKVSISRFCRTFGTLLSSGVPILQTLTVAKEATGNVVLEQAIDKVRTSIKEGESIAEPLSHYKLFPPLVTNMITVGEETGTLSKMLLKISTRYDEAVDVLVSQLTSLIEPFLIIGLGGIVAFIVIALFLPLVAVVQSLTGF